MYINIRLLVAVFLVSNTKFVQCRDDKSVQSEGIRRLKIQNKEIYEATDHKLRDYLGYYGNFISEKDRNWCPRKCNSRTKILVSPNFSAYCTCNKNGKTVHHQCKKFEIFNSTTSSCTPLLGNGNPTCVLRNRTCPSNRIGIEKHPNSDLYQNYIICMEHDVIVAKCKPNHYYKESQKSCAKIEGRKTVLSHSDCDEALKIKCTVPGITKLEDQPSFRQTNKCQNCYVICSEKDKNTFDLMIQCNKRKRVLPFLYHQPIDDIIKIPEEIDKTRHISHTEPLLEINTMENLTTTSLTPPIYHSENNKELIETTTILINKNIHKVEYSNDGNIPINKTEDGTNENKSESTTSFENGSHETPGNSETEETFPGTVKYIVGPILIKKKPFIKKFIKKINNPTNVEETNEESDETEEGSLEKTNKPKVNQNNHETPKNNVSNTPTKTSDDSLPGEIPKKPSNGENISKNTFESDINILKDDTPDIQNDDDNEADYEDISTDALEELDEKDNDLPDNLMKTIKNEEPKSGKINKIRIDTITISEEPNSNKINTTESNEDQNIENDSTEEYDKPKATEYIDDEIESGPTFINKPIIEKIIKKVYPKKKTTKKHDTVSNTSSKSKDHLPEIEDDSNNSDESPNLLNEPIENEKDLNKPKSTDTIYDETVIGAKPILLGEPLIKKIYINKHPIKKQNPVSNISTIAEDNFFKTNSDSDNSTEYTSSDEVVEKNSNESETITEDDSNKSAEEDSKKSKINQNNTTLTIEIGDNKSNSPEILEDHVPEETADMDYETSDDEEPITETPNKFIKTEKDSIKPKLLVKIKIATRPNDKEIKFDKSNPKKLTPITDEDILSEVDEEPTTNSPDDKILTHDSDEPNPTNNTNDLPVTESDANSEETEIHENDNRPTSNKINDEQYPGPNIPTIPKDKFPGNTHNEYSENNKKSGQTDVIPNGDNAKNNSSISENKIPDSRNSVTEDIFTKLTTSTDLENVELTTVLPLYNNTNSLTGETTNPIQTETPDAGIKSQLIKNKIIKHVLLKPKPVYLFHSPALYKYNKHKRPPGITSQLEKDIKLVDKEPDHYFEEEHPINFATTAERPVKNKTEVISLSLIKPLLKIVRKKPKKYLVKNVEYPKLDSNHDENFPIHHSILLRKPSKSIDGGHVLNTEQPDNKRHTDKPQKLEKKKRFTQRPIKPKIVKKVQNNEPLHPDPKNFILVNLGDVNNETILLEEHERDHDIRSSHCEVKEKDRPCPDKGFYRYEGSCSIHYECYYKKECNALVASRLYQCPHCLQFNAKKKRCDLPQNVPECTYHEEDEQKFKGHRLTVPVQACSGPGIFKDPGNPNRYYKCLHILKDGVYYLTLAKCPTNQIFNDVLKKCIPGDKKQRANRRIVEGGHKKGSYVFDKYSCWRFFHNTGGPLIELHCPDGYIFNGKTCDNMKNSIFCNWDELKKYLYKR